jgi:energy-coupling factor transporter ATP-binding protein EcfA2
VADQAGIISKIEADFAASVAKALDTGGKFVLVSGDSGSGRTTVCEQVSSILEPRYQTIFLPCTRDQDPKQLRELFLQQLLPGSKWDLSLNLADSLRKAPIPGRRKILVIADDVDKAVSGFFKELEALCMQASGSGRFAFLASCHPLWAAQAVRQTRIAKMEEFPVPELTEAQSLEVARSMYEQAGLSDVFSAVMPALSVVLRECKGNIGAVIRQTENLMADPKNAAGGMPGSGGESEEGRRKHGAGIFITIVCVIIVLACMIPLFMGTGFLSSLFGGKDGASTDAAQQQAEVQQAAGTAGSGAASAGSQQGGAGSADVEANPLRTSRPAVGDIKVNPNAPKGTADKAMQDDGALLPDVGEGIEVKSPDQTSRNSVTLRGDTLDKIENSEAGSGKDPGLPRRGLAGSEVKDGAAAGSGDAKAADGKADDGAKAPAGDGKISRADNSLRSKEIAQEEATLAKEAEAKRLADLKYAEEHKAEAEAAAAEQAKAKAIADRAAEELDDKPAKSAEKAVAKAQPKSKKTRRTASRSSSRSYRYGGGVPGASAELDTKNPNHYSLQVIAGRDRYQVVQASAYVSGRYWIYETTRDGKPWYVLVTGDYASSAAALRDARRLPGSLRANRPFAKTFDRIQTEKRLSSNGR